MKFFIIEKKHKDFGCLHIGKGRTLGICRHSYEDILELSKKYKYVIKSCDSFRIIDFTGIYSSYIFTNCYISNDEIDFLNYLNKVSYNNICFINDLNILTLYKIRHKIEVI